MKAHRRNGIPTLMLQDGGGSLISRFFNANPAQRKAREQQRMGLRSILLAKPTPLTNIDQQSYDIITEAIRPLQSFYQQSESGSASRGMSPTDYAKSLADSYVKLGEYISGSQVGTGLRRSNADPNPVLQVGSQFAANLQERIGAEINRVNPVEPVSDSMYEFSVQDALLGSAQDSAARAEADALRQATGAPTRAEEAAATATTPAATATTPAGTATTPAGTATTPAETAATPAETAATSAETAATPAATVAPEGPEKEALRQATGAPTKAEEAAATAATPTGTAAEQPIAIKPDDSVAGTLNSILLGDGAKFDDRERLKQLKETFGLNLSDMERSAPALAFSFALMGATKEPGESPLQAFIRNAGTAGQSALAQQQALDAKQRSIDAALISPILTERRAAETIERDKEWVTYWDGTTKDGLPNFKSTKMNARQIEEAQKNNIQLVPLGLAGTYISQSAAVIRANKEAEVDLEKALIKQAETLREEDRKFQEQRGERVAGQVVSVGSGDGKRTVVRVVANVNGKPTPIVYNADLSTSLSGASAAINLAVDSVGTVRDMRKSLDQGALGAKGAGSFVLGSAKDYFFGGKGSNPDQTLEALREAGGVKGDLAWNGDGDPEAVSLLRKNMGDKYKENLSAAENYKRYFESTAVFARISEDQISELRANAEKINDVDQRSRYQARVDYLVKQRALAATLAQLILGETGKMISDGDRVRVVQIMGDVADLSKGGLLATPESARASLEELESILGGRAKKFAESIETDARELKYASEARVFGAGPDDRAFVTTPAIERSLEDATKALDAYRQLFPTTDGSNASKTPVIHLGSVGRLTASK
jgi:hypothetical protein